MVRKVCLELKEASVQGQRTKALDRSWESG
jgi:hypothetical protein